MPVVPPSAVVPVFTVPSVDVGIAHAAGPRRDKDFAVAGAGNGYIPPDSKFVETAMAGK